jgi:hypothetical protein
MCGRLTFPPLAQLGLFGLYTLAALMGLLAQFVGLVAIIAFGRWMNGSEPVWPFK